MSQEFTPAAYNALYRRLEHVARRSFPVFLALMFPQNRQGSYKLGAFQLYLADLVQGMFDGTQPGRWAVSAPPQHGKSQLLAVRMVAWLIGAQPGVYIVMTGFSRSLLVDFLQEVRALIQLPTYRALFPNVAAVVGRDRADHVLFTNGSSVLIRSSGSKLAGRRADWLIVDDPHPGRAEAESPTQRRKVVQWFFADCMTRLSQQAKVLLIGTRWHPHDLIGHLTSREMVEQLREEGQEHTRFHTVNLPALARSGDPLGRQEGEPLCPDYRPLSFLHAQRALMLGYEWDSLFMGTPRSSASGQVDVNSLRRCDLSQVPQGIRMTRGWDLAITESQSSDYTVGVKIGYDAEADTIYIMDVFRQRMAWARLRANMIRTSEADLAQNGIARIGVEGVSGFDIVCQEIRSLLAGRVSVVRKNPPRGGKLMRAQQWLAKLEAGKVVMVRGAWNRDFVEELEQFPDGANDDQMDGLSIAWETLRDAATDLLLA